jgi:predicted transcriptional regulator
MSGIKAAAHTLVENLADDATWEELQYAISVRRAIEAGLADADAGRVISVDDLRRSFGLTTDADA